MTQARPRMFVLDTNVFIQAHRRYYPFDVCPGFWDCLVHFCQESRLTSIDHVRREIVDGDALSEWAKSAPRELFASTMVPSVIACYRDIMNWVQRCQQFKDEAKSHFASGADGWVIAFAMAHGGVVVTHESHKPNRSVSVPMPSVCHEFSVPYQDTFSMLRELEVRFSWIR